MNLGEQSTYRIRNEHSKMFQSNKKSDYKGTKKKGTKDQVGKILPSFNVLHVYKGVTVCWIIKLTTELIKSVSTVRRLSI